MSQFFSSDGHSIGASASASVLPKNIQDWFLLGLYLLAVQGTLKSLLEHHSSKASILRCSTFFMVQLSHPYMTIGKTIALTRWTVVGKAMSLLFNMLSRFGIAFPPRNKRLLISWLQSPSAVILEPPKIKSVTVSIFSPSMCHEVMGPDAILRTNKVTTGHQSGPLLRALWQRKKREKYVISRGGSRVKWKFFKLSDSKEISGREECEDEGETHLK